MRTRKGATREYNFEIKLHFIVIARPIYITDLFCDKYYVKGSFGYYGTLKHIQF